MGSVAGAAAPPASTRMEPRCPSTGTESLSNPTPSQDGIQVSGQSVPLATAGWSSGSQETEGPLGGAGPPLTAPPSPSPLLGGSQGAPGGDPSLSSGGAMVGAGPSVGEGHRSVQSGAGRVPGSGGRGALTSVGPLVAYQLGGGGPGLEWLWALGQQLEGKRWLLRYQVLWALLEVVWGEEEGISAGARTPSPCPLPTPTGAWMPGFSPRSRARAETPRCLDPLHTLGQGAETPRHLGPPCALDLGTETWVHGQVP